MNINLALELLVALLTRSTEISSLIANARAQGREELSAEEWQSILSADDAARQALADAISAARPPE